MTIGQEGCQRAPPQPMEAVHLKEYLAKNPSEYSYFDKSLVSAWAGPKHWRMKPLSKGLYLCIVFILLQLSSSSPSGSYSLDWVTKQGIP